MVLRKMVRQKKRDISDNDAPDNDASENDSSDEDGPENDGNESDRTNFSCDTSIDIMKDN